MKLKLDAFTIFIILLIILVIFMMVNKWFTLREEKENFVDFNSANAINSSVTMYIPQYSTDKNRTLIHLYDNLYFDNKNGILVEVSSLQSTPPVNDNSGNSISKILVVPRDGRSITTYPGKTINGIAIPTDTTESQITTTNAQYDQYTYTSDTLIISTNYRYQIFYYSWNTQTFIHLFNLPSTPTEKAKYISTFLINPTDGLKFSLNNGINIDAVPNKSVKITDYTLDDLNNKNDVFLPSYLEGKIKVYQLTPKVFYDVINGNIIIKGSDEKVVVYDRGGAVKPTPANTGQSSQLTGNPVVFACSNGNSGMVLVTSYLTKTIVSVIVTDNGVYKIAASQRFNKTQKVNDLATDIDDTVKVTSVPQVTASSCEGTKKYDTWNKTSDSSNNRNICGSDPTCWYWYFKTLPSLNDNISNEVFSDDYFLKTESIPPVCPQCPNCPDKGTCTDCGGTGGAGTNVNGGSGTNSGCSNVSLKLIPVESGSKYKDDLGNIYISYSDTSGNKKYILQGTGTAGTTTGTAGTAAPNVTTVSGVASSALTLDQTGASLINNTSGIANNLINTAGGALGTAGNLLKDTGSGAVDLLKDTGSGAVNLLKDTGSGAVGLLKDVGSGISNLGQGRLQQNNQQYGPVTGSSGATGATGANTGLPQGMGSVSDKTFGKMPGQTPVDNYSYYGALESKGGNFMPVTADFSSFRK